MTTQNDWSAVSEELDEIKRSEYHRGYEKALEDSESAEKIRLAREDKLSREITTWNNLMSKVRDAWSKHTGLDVRWMDPTKDNHRYQMLFGNNAESTGNHYVHMPEDTSHFVFALDEITKMANDFQILLDAFEKNPIVKAQWDRLLVAMRMTDE